MFLGFFTQDKNENCNIIKSMETIFDANDLRRPGYYKWYAPEELYKEILAKLDIDYDEVKSKTEILIIDNKTFYGIYIGIAEEQPLIKRVGFHLSNKSFDSSTLRKSIATLYETKKDETINTIFALFKVRLFFSNTANLSKIETEVLKKYYYALNIDKNPFFKDKYKSFSDRRTDFFDK